MTRGRRLSAFVAAPLLLICAGVAAGYEYVEGTVFVIRAAGITGAARTATGVAVNAFDERTLTVPWRGGDLEARAYVPRGGGGRAVLLVPGVHASGIDEPRLAQFARDLASLDQMVLTVELRDLTQYRITPVATDMVEDAALWLTRQPALAADGRVGMIGISFAGGLSIVAASRPSIRDRVAFVMSFGGHGDLPRTLRYLCTGIQPDGTRFPPHDYGVAIILLGVAERVVPAGQVGPLRDAILTFLEGSRLDMVDKQQSAVEFARARAMADALDEPARSLMKAVNDRDVATLGPILLPHVGEMGGHPALSPARSMAPSAQVYLLHGTGDNVIPAIESSLLRDELRSRGVEVRALATPLITHAEVNNAAAVADLWKLIGFWAHVLDH